MADWETTYLRSIGAPNTAQNRKFLAAWQRWEGGHTNNNARFNYMNTTQRMPGSHGINSVGVQAYSSLRQGANAFGRTLKNGRYSDLLSGLRSGNPYKANITAGLSTWLSGSPTSSNGASYAAKVLGLDVAPPPVTGGGRQTRPGPGKNRGPGRRTQGVAPRTVEVAPDLSAPRLQTLGMLSQGHFDPMDSLNALTESLMAQGHTQSANQPVTMTIPGQPARAVKVGKSPKTGLTAAVEGPVNGRAKQVIGLAERFLGTPYQWGGETPATGFDCSGLLQYVWGKNGVNIPRVSQDQWKAGKAVSKGHLRPGDAVFFEMGSSGPGHVGMYIGNGRFIESPHTGANVRISKLAGRSDYVGARRFGGQPRKRK